MSTIGLNAVLVYQMLVQKAEKDAQKVLEKEAKGIGDAIAKTITQEMLDTEVEKLLAKQFKKHLPKADKLVLGAVTGQLKKLHNAKKLPPDPSGFDPTKLKAFGPVYQPKPLSSGKLHAYIPIPLRKLLGPKGKKVVLEIWLGIDHAKLMKQEWNLYGGVRLRR